MADVFLSYASEDRAFAQRLATAVEAEGKTVWWDRELLAGQHYQKIIDSELDASLITVVIWTPNSVQSPWVSAEAEAALQAGKLIPLVASSRISGEDIPLPFRFVQAANLTGWNGADDDPEFLRLMSAIHSLTTVPGSSAIPSRKRTSPAKSRARVPNSLVVGFTVTVGLISIAAVLFIRGRAASDPETPGVTSGEVARPASTVTGPQGGVASSTEPTNSSQTTVRVESRAVTVPNETSNSVMGAITISVDDGYDLYLNGELTASSWMTSEVFRLNTQAGINVIGVRVAADEVGPRGLTAELELDGETTIVLPGDWSTLALPDPGDDWAQSEPASDQEWTPGVPSEHPPDGLVTGSNVPEDGWAWASNTDSRLAHFRYEFERDVPGTAFLRITAAKAYTLTVNGSNLGGGFVAADTWTVDLAPGMNTIGVRALNVIGPGGAIVAIEGDGFSVTSDDLWRCTPEVDQAGDPAWSTTGYPDSSWRSCKSYGTQANTPYWTLSSFPDNVPAEWVWTTDINDEPTNVILVDGGRLIRHEFDVP